MKKILMWGIMAVSMAGCMNSNMKSKNMSSAAVPDEVVASFNQRYPYATDVHWGMEKGLYEAKFKEPGVAPKDVLYRFDGTLVDVKVK
jgi:hypothetical protein